MPDLTTHYLGLSLGNPLIAGSSGLSASAEGVERLAEAGAGAVVLKSVFEEEIALEYQAIVRDALRAGGNPEALDYLDRQLRGERLDRYRALIAESKRRVDIPVIASVHCTYSHEWVTFAREMEAAGADALELNMFFLPTDWSRTADEQEQAYLRVIERVRDEVSIPVALKISHYFTSLGPMIQRLSQTGVAGLVLFNRLWQPDFDIERLQVVPSRALSTPAEITLSLRWVALTAGRAACDLAASTGVHDGEGAIKMLLAGARAVQVVSALYLHGVSHLRAMLIDLARWMDDHGYETIDEFRGLLSQAASANPAIYERVQYMRFFGPTLEGQAGDVPPHGLEGPPR
ncbi:MAG: dihydroorotate dehydrogenase-like protein [Chloroflexi bacterium]|nr:dihydroorotate dehydrogenase-like protein [Chloroflexota bacterium]